MNKKHIVSKENTMCKSLYKIASNQ